MGLFRPDNPDSPSVQERGEDHGLPGRFRQKSRVGVPARRRGQPRDPQTGDRRDGRPFDRRLAEPRGYGVREKQQREFRFRERSDPDAHRGRLGYGDRHDARRRLRHRHGGRAGGAGFGGRSARTAGMPVHGRRGDRTDRGLRAGRGYAFRQVSDQPRFGG